MNNNVRTLYGAIIGLGIVFSVGMVERATANGTRNQKQYLAQSAQDQAFLNRSLTEGTLRVCRTAEHEGRIRFGQVDRRIENSGEIKSGETIVHIRLTNSAARISVVRNYNVATEPIQIEIRNCQ